MQNYRSCCTTRLLRQKTATPLSLARNDEVEDLAKNVDGLLYLLAL